MAWMGSVPLAVLDVVGTRPGRAGALAEVAAVGAEMLPPERRLLNIFPIAEPAPPLAAPPLVLGLTATSPVVVCG